LSTLALILILNTSDPFVAEATASTSYEVSIPRDSLRLFVDDVGLFSRHMPGVVSVRENGPDRFLYLTEKSLPLAGTMQTEFDIQKRVSGDSVFVYESVDLEAANYMYNRVTIHPAGDRRTTIAIDLKVRLKREGGGEVHWLAPILGQAFISKQMANDLNDMLERFVESSNRELYDRLQNAPRAAR
jgi:carbon monoxide dehydrogenase subunit G